MESKASLIFEVIKILDDTNPYPILHRIDWDFDNQVIINLKRGKMIFKSGHLRVLVPLDPMERY